MNKILCSLALLITLVGRARTPMPAATSGASPKIIRLDPAFDSLAPTDAKIEKAATGFQFTEVPLWRPEGVLWFSDVPGSLVRSVSASGEVKTIIHNAGGMDSASSGALIGPNGMVADSDGAVLLCQHGARRIVRVARETITPYIEKFEGHRLNSPNDLVYHSGGALYFADPPFGLTKLDDDPAKELKFNGVFLYRNGRLTPIVQDLSRPNGIARERPRWPAVAPARRHPRSRKATPCPFS